MEGLWEFLAEANRNEFERCLKRDTICGLEEDCCGSARKLNPVISGWNYIGLRARILSPPMGRMVMADAEKQ